MPMRRTVWALAIDGRIAHGCSYNVIVTCAYNTAPNYADESPIVRAGARDAGVGEFEYSDWTEWVGEVESD